MARLRHRVFRWAAVVSVAAGALQVTQPAAQAITEPHHDPFYYVQTLNSPGDYTNYGKALGQQIAAGAAGSSLVVLDFGEQTRTGAAGTGTYTVRLVRGGGYYTRAQIQPIATNFANGFVTGLAGHAGTLNLGLAINNAADTSGNFFASDTGNEARAWSHFVLQVKAALSSTVLAHVSLSGGINAEIGWNSGTVTRAWADAFDASDNLSYYAVDDSSGCPKNDRTNCVSGGQSWKLDDAYYVAWRATGALTYPEIYDPDPATGTSASAQQWANMSRYGVNQYAGGYIYFEGALSQRVACDQSQADQTTCKNKLIYNTPAESYNQLYTQLATNSSTALTPPFVADIQYGS